MNKIILAVLILIATSPLIYAQPDTIWTVTIGDSLSEGARSICPTSDGGVMVAGYTFSYGQGSADIMLVKIDADGNMLSSYTFGGERRDYANRIYQTSDNGYIVIGYTSSYGAGGKDVYLLKTSPDGVLDWQATYGTPLEEVGLDVTEISTGGYIISGHAESDDLGEHDTYIIRVDADGNELWSEIYNDLGSTWGNSIFQSGEYFVFGGTKTSSSGINNRDCYLTWIDDEGNIYDMATYGSNSHLNHDWCHSIIRTSDNGYLLVGKASRHSAEIYDFSVIKTESDGSYRWQQLHGVSTYYDYGRDAVELTDGGYLLCGVTKSTTTKNDIHLIKIDSTGAEVWQSGLDWPGVDWADDICEVSDGYIIAGQTNSRGAGAFDMLLVKYSNLEPAFSADPTSGHAPLLVNFTDQSVGNVNTWEWDFNNDGIADSYEQNPSWEYTEPGDYSVKLIISNGGYPMQILYEDYISVFEGQSALEFDGETSYVSSPASESMNLIGPLTVEAWIYPYGWGENFSMGMGSILDKDCIELFLYKQGGLNDHSLICYLKNSAGTYSFYYTPENSIVLDQWQHVAFTYDAVNDLKIYINGAEQELTYTSEIEGQLEDNLDTDLIVGNSIEGSHTFDGVIDELRIWNTVRAAQLINACMNHYVYGGTDNLILNWRMDEGNGEYAWDSSYFLNNGVLSNVVWTWGKELEQAEIAEDNSEKPVTTNLSCAYPNPFNDATIIRFELSHACEVNLNIYDILGRKVQTLIADKKQAGSYQVCWNAGDLASGIYFYRLSTEDYVESKILVLLK